MDDESSLDVGMSVVRGCLLVPVQGELRETKLRKMQAEILKRVETTGTKAVIIDLSAVRVLDTHAFRTFVDAARMASLLGATTVFAGIQPGVAAALVDLEVEFDGLRTALTLEDAIRQLEPVVSPPAEKEEMDDATDEEHTLDETGPDGELQNN